MNLSEITDISVTLNVAIVSQIYAYVQNYQNNALNMHRFLCTYCSSIKLLKKKSVSQGYRPVRVYVPDQAGSEQKPAKTVAALVFVLFQALSL